MAIYRTSPLSLMASTTDVTLPTNFTLPAGSIIAVDRGYCDFDLFAQWNHSGVFFVTRLKDNAAYEVIEDYPVPQHSNVLTDQDHPLYRTSNQSQVSGTITPGSSLGSRQRKRNRAVNQSSWTLALPPSAKSIVIAGRSNSFLRCSNNISRSKLLSVPVPML